MQTEYSSDLQTQSKTPDFDLGAPFCKTRGRVPRVLERVGRTVEERSGGAFGISGSVLNWLYLYSLPGTQSHSITEVLSVEAEGGTIFHVLLRPNHHSFFTSQCQHPNRKQNTHKSEES